MKREIVIDSLCDVTRAFLFEDEELCEAYFLSEEYDDVAGCVYLGSVENLSKSLNAAFVDIGLEQNAFLNLDDMPPEKRPIRPGDRVIVQADKPPVGNKGVRLNGFVKISGEFVVLMPFERCVRISSSIKDDSTRERLTEIGRRLTEELGCGMIMRTEAEKAEESDIIGEYDRLYSTFNEMKSKADALRPPVKLLGQKSLSERIASICRDAAVKTDDKRVYEELSGKFKIEFADTDIPLSDIRRCDTAFERMIKRRVTLPSGGNIVVDKTEAMTVIDVNSAGSGRAGKEETALTTNLEAARAIMRLLRLRNISGIIAIDFIDMTLEEDKKLLEEELRELKRRDRGKPVVYPLTEPGVALITRKRCGKCAFEVYSESNETWRAYYRAAVDLRRRRAAAKENPIIINADKALCEYMHKRGFKGLSGIYCVEDDSLKDSFSISTAARGSLPDMAKEIDRGQNEADRVPIQERS